MEEKILVEINSLSPSAMIELYELDGSNIGMSEKLYFHAGTNSLGQNIIWQGQEYVRFPIEVDGFEMSSQGVLPRPKMKVSNHLSIITTYLLEYSDLSMAKVTRKRTHKRFLDAANFPDGNEEADPEAYFPDDIFYIDRKVNENRDIVEFELVSSIDLAGVRIPRRQIIQNLCPWRYKGGECGYTGENYFKADDSSTEISGEDVCGKRVSSCKLRFGNSAELPFGGFPGAGLFSR